MALERGVWDLRSTHAGSPLHRGGIEHGAAPADGADHLLLQVREFYDAVPAALDVHLILDNYGTHKTPAIHRWLLRHPRFHRHFTPTGASWINLVERWFGVLTEKQIRRGTHRSTPQLEAAILRYIADGNQHPKPFVWTKTADEILASVA